MTWDTDLDVFRFDVQPKGVATTRRGILSAVASVYDPIGLVSPFLLQGKAILQDLCAEGLQWDDPVGFEAKTRWERWKGELPDLAALTIPRCYLTERFGKLKVAQLHSFSDASTVGYGACSYLRVIDQDNMIQTALVAAS